MLGTWSVFAPHPKSRGNSLISIKPWGRRCDLLQPGAPPDQLLGGQVGNLYVVRQYLDAQCTASP